MSDDRTGQTFGQRLRLARTAIGLRQEDVAKRVGVSRTQIVNLEADRSDPSVSTLIGLCGACQVSADALLGLAPIPETTHREAALRTQLSNLQQSIREASDTLRALAGEG